MKADRKPKPNPDRVRELAAQGHTDEQMAEILGVTIGAIRWCRREHDIRAGVAQGRPKKLPADEWEARARAELGDALQRVDDAEGLAARVQALEGLEATVRRVLAS